MYATTAEVSDPFRPSITDNVDVKKVIVRELRLTTDVFPANARSKSPLSLRPLTPRPCEDVCGSSDMEINAFTASQ